MFPDPSSRSLTRGAPPPAPPRTCCTEPLKPYQGVRASTTTQSPGASASAAPRAPGMSLFLCSAAWAASAAASRSRRSSPMAAPTSRSPAAPPSCTCSRRSSTMARRRRSCAPTCERCSASSWLRRRSRRACSSPSAWPSSDSRTCNSRWRSAAALSAAAARASRSSATLSCSWSWASSSSALRWSARSERWSSLSSASARRTSGPGSSRRRAVSMAWDSPTQLRTSLNVGRPPLYSMAATSVPAFSRAQFFSCVQCVVATTRAPVSSSASRIALASAAPCIGSVPVPASSTRMRARLPAPLAHPRIILDATRCAEYVDKSSTMVCMSPISASTTSKKSIRADSPAGTGMPHRTSRASRPTVLSTTVFPPALGPLRTTPCSQPPSSRRLPTTRVPPRRSRQGFRAWRVMITPSSPTSGTSPSMSSPRKRRARAKSISPAASREALNCAFARDTATHIRPRMRRTMNFSSRCISVKSPARPTSSWGST
mmetsp:Transcript_94515/g.291385  ORF Transcript_94515/g.291385 Transcript_94515/m.291385 type:complete len:487 (+) Transcript_94515:326-1786(+)